MLSFLKAREYALQLNLTSYKAWEKWSRSGKRPAEIPAAPHDKYRGKGFVSYCHFLGYDDVLPKGQMLSFRAARAYVRKQGLKNWKDWERWSKGGSRPMDIPASPQRHYRSEGWISFADWMGHVPKPKDKKKTPACTTKKRKKEAEDTTAAAAAAAAAAVASPTVIMSSYDKFIEQEMPKLAAASPDMTMAAKLKALGEKYLEYEEEQQKQQGKQTKKKKRKTAPKSAAIATNHPLLRL